VATVVPKSYGQKSRNPQNCLQDQERGGTVMTISGKERRKWLPRPLAFFEWETEKARLMPLAIEVSRGGKVFTPFDTKAVNPSAPSALKDRFKVDCDNWFFAKVCVSTADAMHHELSSHLACALFFCHDQPYICRSYANVQLVMK
jgi:hypothetical protein